MKKALLVFGGNNMINNSKLKEMVEVCEIVVAVDHGADHLKNVEIIPDIIIGDFDSALEETIKYFEKCGTEKIVFPIEKDMCDGELAVEIIKNRGYEKLFIVGADGGRVDHMLGNIFLLEKYSGLEIITENEKIFMLEKSNIIKNLTGKTISIISLTDKSCIKSIKGMKYSGEKIILQRGDTRGISNIVEKNIAEIDVEYGKCIIITQN